MLIVLHRFLVSTNKQINGICSVMTLASQSFRWFCSSWMDRDDPEHAKDPALETPPPDTAEAAGPVPPLQEQVRGAEGQVSVLGEGSCWVLSCVSPSK